MFGMNAKKAAMLEERVKKLENECAELSAIKYKLTDENAELTSTNEQLKQKKKMGDEMIAHKLTMREEQVEMNADKRVEAAQIAANKTVADVKDEYRDKIEKQLEKRGDELKEMYVEILGRLPDVSLAIEQNNSKS
jgi:acyl-CoA synthetase (NDP forming)